MVEKLYHYAYSPCLPFEPAASPNKLPRHHGLTGLPRTFLSRKPGKAAVGHKQGNNSKSPLMIPAKTSNIWIYLYCICLHAKTCPFATVTNSTNMVQVKSPGMQHLPGSPFSRLWPKHSSELGFQGVGIFPKVLQDQVRTKKHVLAEILRYDSWNVKQLHNYLLYHWTETKIDIWWSYVPHHTSFVSILSAWSLILKSQPFQFPWSPKL